MSYWSTDPIHVEFNINKFTFLLENYSSKTDQFRE